MSLSLRRRLQKSLALTFFIGTCGSAVLAQALNSYNHVVSIVEDKGGHFVLVGTSKAKMAPRPVIRYLPGENGSTIMVADFPDLVFDRPTTIFTPPVSGLIQVRFAQLEQSPPVFRIAITTAEPEILRRLEFDAKPGTLIIKWPASYSRVMKAPERITWEPAAETSAFAPTVMPRQGPSSPLPGASAGAPVLRGPQGQAANILDPERSPSHVISPLYPAASNPSSLSSGQSAASSATSKQAGFRHDGYKNATGTAAASNVPSASTLQAPAQASGITGNNGTETAVPKLAPDFIASKQSLRHKLPARTSAASNVPSAAASTVSSSSAAPASLPPQAPARTSNSPASKRTENTVPKPAPETVASKHAGQHKLSSQSTATSQVASSSASQASAQTSGITANNGTDGAMPKLAPDFRLPKNGPLSAGDSAAPASAIQGKPFAAQAYLPAIAMVAASQVAGSGHGQSNASGSPTATSTASPVSAGRRGQPDASVPPIAMLAASQVTGSGQAQPGNVTQPSAAQSFLDKMKRTANFIESTSQNSVQKLLPQISKETNLLVGQTAAPETKPVQTMAISGFCPLKIMLTANTTLSYNAFRLHDPDRYVIDIQGLPELTTASEPNMPDNAFVNDLRLSHGEQDSNRLIFDLTAGDIPIKEILSDDKKSLSLTIGDGVNLFARLKAPTNAVVVLDAGHGGSDPGAERGDIQEKEITLEIVDRLKSYLQSKGLKVVLTRSSDTFVSLEDRVNITNSVKPDCFVSVHVNSMETTSTIHGIETYYQSPQSRQLASVIHDSLVDNLSAPDRNVRKARFYVVNHTPIPAILAEVGFISNKDERERLISSDYQAKVAEALADGVILYLDKRSDTASSGENAVRQVGASGRALSNRSGTVSK